ncbi:MAG: hypothetical protein A2408_01360 [Candidatus Yonathbacteria bacterium RIFOXYC1_FULL_52_10]|uniref:Uncharacterized protein n=1 Tax=Candidatus Yonathbacteria bacterium RIFOXYD1_FULL_52_36 TaxID=1802730 RepID=A0A1G2SIH6_9BACT|nr:MAG: hypothetical protein A2591_01005 [Candidatus Yonathbacteria bacterium RIFOXYD1_FULL_52_36]OHA85538.1 MAG: hypothetical protein A2408_01360 [Candidatus Yonathbacteria bacterium RIFOXYC1_FULL_52_10]
MPKNAMVVLNQQGRCEGALYLMVRAAMAEKTLFSREDEIFILRKNNTTREDYYERVMDLVRGEYVPWVDFFTNFDQQDSHIRTYLSDCDSKERDVAKTLCGDAGYEFFHALSPFAGFDLCVYEVPCTRAPSERLNPNHLLARLAAKEGVNEPGERALILIPRNQTKAIDLTP